VVTSCLVVFVSGVLRSVIFRRRLPRQRPSGPGLRLEHRRRDPRWPERKSLARVGFKNLLLLADRLLRALGGAWPATAKRLGQDPMAIRRYESRDYGPSTRSPITTTRSVSEPGNRLSEP
jgi:hypothetical protein